MKTNCINIMDISTVMTAGTRAIGLKITTDNDKKTTTALDRTWSDYLIDFLIPTDMLLYKENKM